MKRLDCLKAIAGKVGDALVVGSAGGATVTRTPRRCTASTSERKSPSPENSTI